MVGGSPFFIALDPVGDSRRAEIGDDGAWLTLASHPSGNAGASEAAGGFDVRHSIVARKDVEGNGLDVGVTGSVCRGEASLSVMGSCGRSNSLL